MAWSALGYVLLTVSTSDSPKTKEEESKKRKAAAHFLYDLKCDFRLKFKLVSPTKERGAKMSPERGSIRMVDGMGIEPTTLRLPA